MIRSDLRQGIVGDRECVFGFVGPEGVLARQPRGERVLRPRPRRDAGDEDHGRGEGENEPAKPNEELLESLNESISFVAEFLRKHDFELSQIITETGFAKNAAIAQAKEVINQNDETRKRFEVMAREVFNKFKACINVPGVNGYRDMRDAINVLYKSLQADKEKADISDIMKELYEIVDGSIDTTLKVKEPKPDGG